MEVVAGIAGGEVAGGGETWGPCQAARSEVAVRARGWARGWARVLLGNPQKKSGATGTDKEDEDLPGLLPLLPTPGIGRGAAGRSRRRPAEGYTMNINVKRVVQTSRQS